MNSIEDLREYAGRFDNSHDAWSGIARDLSSIADNIEREVDDMWHALTIDAKPMTDENMAESGWVRLPKDADGEYIHVGDVMEERDGHTFEVASLMAFGGSDNWLVLSDARNFSSFREPHDIRHHHVPTVEDVLREFVERLDEIGSEDDCVGEAEQECRVCIRRDIAAAYAEYAAKLRLAGEDA